MSLDVREFKLLYQETSELKRSNGGWNWTSSSWSEKSWHPAMRLSIIRRLKSRFSEILSEYLKLDMPISMD